MKTSVVIIAHNEEKYIEDCIKSVLNQTKKADEIILIAHNCIDDTVGIAKRYPAVNTIILNGLKEIIYARLEGLNHVSGDIILCIDGDSIASNNWIEEMSRTLNLNRNILVGSWVKYKGTFLGKFQNIFNEYLSRTKGGNACHWIWGSSFAFWRKDIEQVKKIFSESIIQSQKLLLTRNPEDLWLSSYMHRNGNIEVTNKTHVITHQKEKNSKEVLSRNFENYRNGRRICFFLRNKNI